MCFCCTCLSLIYSSCEFVRLLALHGPGPKIPSLSDADYDFASIAYKDPPDRLFRLVKKIELIEFFYCILVFLML